MKKRFLHMVAFFALAAGLSLTSCSKEDPAQVVDFDSFALAQGTIEGIAFANYDASSAAAQYAPAGTVIFLTVSFNDLGISNAFNGETKQLQATVTGSKGEFKFTGIPLNRYQPTLVTIEGQPFVKGFTYQDGWEAGEPVYVTKDFTFIASQLKPTLQPGSKNFVTITYNPDELFQ